MEGQERKEEYEKEGEKNTQSQIISQKNQFSPKDPISHEPTESEQRGTKHTPSNIFQMNYHIPLTSQSANKDRFSVCLVHKPTEEDIKFS